MVEVPVHHYPRSSGHSQFFRFRAVTETLIQLVRLFIRKGAPARMFAKIPGTLLK
jgi:hypothetical protein